MGKSWIKSRWERLFLNIEQYPFRSLFKLLGGVLGLTILFYTVWWAFHPADAPPYMGFGPYPGPIDGQRSKTLWDWLELLFVPFGLAVVAYLFNRWQKQNEMARDEASRRHQILREYYDEISRLLLEQELATTDDEQIKTLASARTLAALSELDAERKRHLLDFIFKLGLISTPDPKIDLIGADLRGANLAEVAWGGIHLAGVNLDRTKLTQGNFVGANFDQAVLIASKLENAILSHASLQECDLTEAYLGGADLEDANLSAAILTNAKLSNAKMQNALLRGAILDNAELDQVQLNGAILTGTRLLAANLQQVNLYKAELMKVNMTGADMRNAILEETNITEGILKRVDLRETKLDKTILRNADLMGARLQGADFSTAVIEGVKWFEAIRSEVNLTRFPNNFNPSDPIHGFWIG